MSDPRFKSYPNTVILGTVHLVVDSDNETNVDPVKDSQAALNGTKFSFWQADPAHIGFFTTNGGQDGLLDFAPVRVYVGAVPDPSLAKIQLVLQGGNYTANFVVTKNLAVQENVNDTLASQNEKMYLTDSKTAINELTNVGQTSRQCGAAAGYSFEGYLCQSSATASGNSTGVELNGMQSGQMYDVLFSVTSITCPQSPCVLDGSGKLQAVLVKNNGAVQVLDEVPVDVRPLQNWMTIETVRNGSSVTPATYPTLDTAGWEDIPIAAQTLVVLVHGFDNSDNAVQTQNFPDWLKRLYWAGHDVFLPQHKTQTVGISWPGDPGLVTVTQFPVAQFSALETGVPLAKWLTNLSLVPRKIEIFAHSLGNMVVNSALSRSEFKANGVTSYVMNEAAVPAEAFYPSYPSEPLFDQHALDYGWSDTPPNPPFDQQWQTQWNTLDNGKVLDMHQQWVNKLSAATYVTSPPPIYQLRWNQQRPPTGVMDSAPFNSTPVRGSWLGLFAGNLSKTNIFNTFNTNDDILNTTMSFSELNQKPYSGGLGLGNDQDDSYALFWATLLNTDSSQEALWGDPMNCNISTCLHSNIVRQWAELAYWFPARTHALGANSFNLAKSNLNLTTYSPPSGSGFAGQIANEGTHSYLETSPYATEYQAWKAIAAMLQ